MYLFYLIYYFEENRDASSNYLNYKLEPITDTYNNDRTKNEIFKTKNGNFLISVGNKFYKVNSEGEVLWEETFGKDDDKTRTTTQLENDGFVITYGEEHVMNSHDLVKYNLEGEKESPENIILQVGPNSEDNFKVELTDVTTEGLDIKDTSIATREGAQETLSSIDEAIGEVSSERSRFGADQNALEHVENNLTSYEENIESSKSRIEDADMAKQFMKKTKQDILSEAGMAFLAQVNMMPQGILEILG